MGRYRFSAIDTAGKQKTGLVEAESTEEAHAKVSSMGLMPTKMSLEIEQSKSQKRASRKGQTRSPDIQSAKKGGLPIGPIINREDLAIFTRQLATLLYAGLPLLRSLEVLIRQERNGRFSAVLENLADTVQGGGTFSDALQAHPKVFNRLFVNMVVAGEAGGNLAEVLDGLARFMEKGVKTTKKIQSAMVYPIVVMGVACVIVGGLMMFVVPSFQNIFAELLEGAPLPAPTQVVITFSNFVKNQFMLALGLLILAIMGFSLFKKTRAGQEFMDKLSLMVPGFGGLIQKANVAVFSRTFGTLLDSGVPILEALKITRDIVGNSNYRTAVERIHDRVRDGEPVSVPMERETVFPTLVTSMVEVGEETGALPDMLGRIADNYDEDVDNAVAGITSIIEPVMIVLLAVVVGFIVIALFLPIIEVIRSGFM